MCLEVKTRMVSRAGRAILCYKVGFLTGNLFSPASVRTYDYKLGELQEETIQVKADHNYQVHKAYHSYMNIHKAMYNLNSDHRRTVQVFIIPKGSTYFEGTVNGEEAGYASSQIVWIGSPYNPVTWLNVIKWKLEKLVSKPIEK